MQERRLEAMERRLERINNANNPSYETPPSHLESFDVREQEPVLKEDMMFRGKGFKTQFYGSTSVLSVLTQVYGFHKSMFRFRLTPRASLRSYKYSIKKP